MTETGIETADGVQRVRHHRVGDRLRLRHRRAHAHGDPRPGRPRARGPLGRRPDDVPRRPDHRLPEPLLPRRAARRGRQQPAVQRRPGRLHHRHARVRRATTATTRSRSTPRPRSGGPTWSTAARRRRPFGESSYFFGTNIPGKPRKYLLNSGGRPKLFKEIAEVVDERLQGVHLSRLVPRARATSDGRDGRERVSRRRRAGAAAAR